MRKITLSLLMVLLSTTIIFAQANYTKTTGVAQPQAEKVVKAEKHAKTSARASNYAIDFEEVDDWSLDFTPWTTADVDGLDTYGFTDITFPHNYEPMAYIAFNPATTDPPMTDDPEIQPYSGERFGACMASVPSGGVGNDDWLISSLVSVGNGSSINLWAKSYTDDYGLERFNVAVSTTTNDPGDFTVISGASYIEAPIAWTEYNFDLSDYAGQEIYVAIQCVSYDAFVFMVDDIVIDPGEEPSACDYFDELAAGTYVAEQLPMWTTWSGAPGTSEDALVTDMYAHTAPNSIVVEGSSDLVRKFANDDITSGAYWISFESYVPTGYTGYWNLQKTVNPGVEWALQTYLWPDGVGHVDANGEDAAQFNFPFDEWFYTSIFVDLDNDWCELYVEGELIVGYEWHLGTFGQGTLYTLGSMNLWAWNDEGDCMHYFDDVCFEPYIEPTLCNDFEDYDDWAITMDPWTLLDVDGLDTYGFTDITFPHNYEPMSYIVFNPATTDPPMTDDPEIQPYEGDKFAACMASVPSGGQGNDDWLISPYLELGTSSTLTFFAKSYTDDYGMERFNVAVSTTGIDPGDFTIISGPDYIEAPVAWTEYIFDLSDYDYQNVYIAIQCVSYDAFVFMVDEICVFTTPTGLEEQTTSALSIYPNPAHDQVNIVSGVDIQEISIMNNIGQVVYHNKPLSSNVEISTSDLITGIYFVRVTTSEGIETRKLMVK